MSNIEFLKRSRGHVRSRVTKLCDKVESLAPLSRSDKLTALSQLQALDQELKAMDREIGAAIWESSVDDTKLSDDMNACEIYNDRIMVNVITLREDLQCEQMSSEAVTRDPLPLETHSRLNKLKLPEIPLPQFRNAKGETLANFLANFDAILDKYQLSSYEKFVYLKKQLQNEPLVLINSLSGANQTYEIARKLLEEAFSRTAAQKFEVIRRLSSLKLSPGGNPYEFVSEMRSIEDLFKCLEIDTETILQYFFWNGMPSLLQSQFISICNNSKPSLKQLNEHMFEALDRFKDKSIGNEKKCSLLSKGEIKNENTTGVYSLASNVNVKEPLPGRKSAARFCTLCSEPSGPKVVSHSTRDCNTYGTPDLKRERLKLLNACMRCGYANHSTDQCLFKFSRPCRNCGSKHMDFLCTKSSFNPAVSKASGKKGPVVQNSINSGVVWTDFALKGESGMQVILPTFTFVRNGMILRGMKDTGCQPHFIKTSVAEALGLPVIDDNYSVTVNGFNESKNYLTKTVTLELQLGSELHWLEAICVPEIPTKLCLPGLRKVAQVFVDKGYVLADSQLTKSDEISDISFILGSNNPEVLTEKQVIWGSPPVCVYSETVAGVILLGNVNNILSNIDHLPDLCVVSSDIGAAIVAASVALAPSNLKHCHPALETEAANSQEIAQPKVDLLSDSADASQAELRRATQEALDLQCCRLLSCDEGQHEEESTEVNDKVVKFILDNTSRRDDGRLVMPLAWRGEVAPFLGNNFDLARQILKANFRKVSKNDILFMLDDHFKELESSGIIEKIYNFEEFASSNPNHSFLPHMPVIKIDRETTKCRVVFLSNLCERRKDSTLSLSHNQTIHAGPCLNQKLAGAMLHLRFDEFLLCFDLKKAFLQIALSESDSNKLLFLWYRNVRKSDFSLIVYRNLRLSFGLRCSPTILMLALYKILCIDVEGDTPELKRFKKHLYALFYMDNGACTGTAQQIRWAYEHLGPIFEAYHFELQQLMTNEANVQNVIDAGKEAAPRVGKLLGLAWDRADDTPSARKIELNADAVTKRQILQSIAAQYDPMNYQGPCLNRARLFMHALQCDKLLSWDTVLSDDLQREWRNIVRQANKTPVIKVNRSMGNRSDKFELIAFTDASKSIYAAVVYLKNLSRNTVHFVSARNRVVGRVLETKTVPSLELQAIGLGVEHLMDVRADLAGSQCLEPINVVGMRLFSDSTISLHWLAAFSRTLDKMQKRSVFVMNRLTFIERQCQKCPISFDFIATNANPADCLTRCLSYSNLQKSCYINGPEFLTGPAQSTDLEVTVPNPAMAQARELRVGVSAISEEHQSPDLEPRSPATPTDKISNLKKLIGIQTAVLKFVNNLKVSLKRKDPQQFSHLVCIDESMGSIKDEAIKSLLRQEQERYFSKELDFLHSKNRRLKDVPKIVNKLNVFLDKDGVIKVRSKFDRWSLNKEFCFPVLLPKSSALTKLIILDAHEKLAHGGCYSLLAYLRKHYWVEHSYSLVKKILRECVVCKRFNARPIKVNQNAYRQFRASPPSEPYKFVFIDYLGPFFVKSNEVKKKVWVLCFTCLWSRAVNLKICSDLSVKNFLRAFQMHVFEEGLPAAVFSDLGSQITSGTNIIKNFIEEPDANDYFSSNGIKSPTFEQFFKGNSALGSLVEVCVKFTKRLMFGAIRNNVLGLEDFEFLIAQTIHLVNKRPIAFKNALRENKNLKVPAPITPELLVKNRDLTSWNIIPHLQPDPDADETWCARLGSADTLRQQFAKLRKVRTNLINTYHEEFVKTLTDQATDDKYRYKKVPHHRLKVNDIVLLKDQFLKASHYPMAIVKEIVENDLGEVTGVVVKKGLTGETVKRHVSSVVPFLCACKPASTADAQRDPRDATKNVERRPLRAAARKAAELTRTMLA